MNGAGVRHALRRRFRFIVTSAIIGGAAILVGMHGHSHGALQITDARGETAMVQEWRGGVKRGEVPVLEAGEMTINLNNTDATAHDFVVIRTDDPGQSLPVKDGRVDLEAAGQIVTAVDPAAPGDTQSRTIDLPPGNYVLICDLPGHYQNGMYYEVEVR